MTPRAVVVTGLFGTGKSTLIEEMAELLEADERAYAAIDLDWLAWFQVPDASGDQWHTMLVRNLTDVIANYRQAGVEYFLMARALRDAGETASIKDALDMPTTVVELTTPLDVIRQRLSASATSGRAVDLDEAVAWNEAGHGTNLGDLAFVNDGDIGELAKRVLHELDW